VQNRAKEYGSAVLGHVPAADWAGVDTLAGIYPMQDTTNEERVWLCTYAMGNFYGCTTHLSTKDGSVAASQCQYLMSDVAPAVRSYE
jgi:hypothetical protein